MSTKYSPNVNRIFQVLLARGASKALRMRTHLQHYHAILLRSIATTKQTIAELQTLHAELEGV
jgi:hypothetical protein